MPFRQIFIFLLLFTFSLPAFSQTEAKSPRHRQRPPKIEKIEPLLMPEISFSDENGEKLTLESFQGNLLLVAFWSSWCDTCHEEMRMFNESHKMLKKQGLEILPISEDFKGVPSILSFYEKNAISNLPIFWDEHGKFFSQFSNILPSSLLIDDRGFLVAKINGPVDFSDPDFTSLINSFMREKIQFPKAGEKEKSGMMLDFNKKLKKIEEQRPVRREEAKKEEKVEEIIPEKAVTEIKKEGKQK